MAVSEALRKLREIEAKKDEAELEKNAETILAYLGKHPDGKPPVELKSMDEFDEFITYRNACRKIEEITKRRKKSDADDALERLLGENMEIDTALDVTELDALRQESTPQTEVSW